MDKPTHCTSCHQKINYKKRIKDMRLYTPKEFLCASCENKRLLELLRAVDN